MISSFLAIYCFFLLFLAIWLLLTDRRLELVLISFLIAVQALLPWIFHLPLNMSWRAIDLILFGSFVFHALAIIRFLVRAFRRLGRSSSDELQLLRG